MTFQEFKAIIMPLAVQLGAEFDLPTWKLYHKALADVPVALLGAAVESAAGTRSKMPSAAQLRDLAEARRQSLLKAHPYTGCAECEDHRGWVEFIDEQGVRRMRVCGCKRMYQSRLEALGVTSQPLAESTGDVRLLAAGEER